MIRWLVMFLLLAGIAVAAPGDSGTMVPSAKNATKPYARINFGFGPAASIQDYAGADPTGATSSDNAFTSCITSGYNCRIPIGTYKIACTSHIGTAGITLFGDDPVHSIIKLAGSCTAANPVIRKINVSNLKIDVNNATGDASNSSIIGPADSGNLSPFVENVSIVNATTQTFLISVASGGSAIVNPIIRNNYLALTSADTTANRCVLFTLAGGGTITGGAITDNICVNAGIWVKSSGTLIARNDVSGWAYSAGIGNDQSASSNKLMIIDNRLHDSATTLDVDSTPSLGIENWSADSTISGNKCWNTGGVCLDQGGQRTNVVGNWAYGTNKHNSAGAGAFNARYADATYNSNNALFIGNWARDDGAGKQYYGYSEQSASLAGIRVIGNDFDGNVTAAANILSASTSASLQDGNGNTWQANGGVQFATGNVGTAVNYVTARGAATGGKATLLATGETNVDLNLVPKGTGGVYISPPGAGGGLVLGSDGNNGALLRGNTPVGSFNPLISAGDLSLLWKGTAADNSNAGNFVIAPWSATSRGFKADYQFNTPSITTSVNGDATLTFTNSSNGAVATTNFKTCNDNGKCLTAGIDGTGLGTSSTAYLVNSGDGINIDGGGAIKLQGSGSNAPVVIGNTAVTGILGELGFKKITASGSAPGAGTCKMEWVAGTGAGTCKLIAYCGTSTSAATVVDNVGGSC